MGPMLALNRIHIKLSASFVLSDTPSAEPCCHLAIFAQLFEEASVPALSVCCSASLLVLKQPLEPPYLLCTTYALSLQKTGYGWSDVIELFVSHPSDVPHQLREYLIDDNVTIIFEFGQMM